MSTTLSHLTLTFLELEYMSACMLECAHAPWLITWLLTFMSGMSYIVNESSTSDMRHALQHIHDTARPETPCNMHLRFQANL